MIDKIEGQHNKILNELINAKEALETVTPNNREQRQILSKIQNDLSIVERILERSVGNLNNEIKESEDLGHKHHAC